MTLDQPTLILCSTLRLVRAVQTALNQQQLAAKQNQWQTPKVMTLRQWLQEFTTNTMLAGEVATDNFAVNSLNNFTEKLLWQMVIEQCLAKHELADLFDVPNLAQTAIEANLRLIEWQISDESLSQYFISSETRQFLRWREVFRALCKKHDALEPARILAMQVDVIRATQLPLPENMQWLGFDRITPLEQYLIESLQTKGVKLEISHTQTNRQNLTQIGLDDISTECRAAVAWAKQHLSENPQADLAIFSPILANIRRPLADLLDDTFHSETLHASQYEAPRIYDFSLGLALSEQAMIGTALNLLRLSVADKAIEQSTISALLLNVYWGDLNELDARSLLDARMRKSLTRTFRLQVLLALAEKNSYTIDCLQSISSKQKAWSKKQLPSAWAHHFPELLQTLNWSKTRSLSSHEQQTKQKWLEVLASFAALDKLTGVLSATDAVRKLQQLCAATMFQPEAGNNVRIQVLGMLESLPKPIDAIWVIGLNDRHWPLPAAPNPLLPAALQRDLQMPGANPEAQSVFAQKIHTRLCNSAAEVIFSWSHKEGERELRVSPLLAGIPAKSGAQTTQTLAEQLAIPAKLELIDDSIAPPVQANEQVRGGSKLFEAQAICPAWAFYQYRLGAKKLEEPSEGLDNMVRGKLVHAVLQHFWLACKDLNTLKSLSNNALEDMSAAAIGKALQQLKNEMSVNLPLQVIKIEQRRLQQLLQTWLALEVQRTDFSVRDCEVAHTLNIEGLEITCRIDRIDVLADGGLAVIDYKTGETLPAIKTWSDQRIHEPQLPLYASFALQHEHVVAACFAKVNISECKFSGIAADENSLPGLSAFSNLKSNSIFRQFSDFPELIAHWHTSLSSIAKEIKNGVASVVFDNEKGLNYCDAKPLLRLPERALQFEQKKRT